MKKVFFYLVLFLFFVNKSQATPVDSSIYYIEKSELSKLDYKMENSIDFVRKSIKFKRLNVKDYSLSIEHTQYGNIYKTFGLYDSSLFHYNIALKELKDQKQVAFIHLQKARIYRSINKQPLALKNLKQALLLFENVKDTFKIGIVNLNLGNVFKSLKKHTTAINYYHNAIKLFKKTKKEQSEASCYNNLGNIYNTLKTYDSAAYYMYKTLEIRERNTDNSKTSAIYHNLSRLHSNLNQLDSALFYINKSLKLKFMMKNETEILSDYFSLGDIYKQKKDYKNSNYYYNQVLKLAIIQKNVEIQMNINKLLGSNYFILKDYKQSAINYRTHTILIDSIESSENYSDLENELISYELVKDSLAKNQLFLINKNEQIRKNNLELKTKLNQTSKNYLKLVVGILLLASALLFFSFKRRLKVSENYKKELELQNNELKRTLISKEEKETLLKEVHHRVKNNLQIINSLIRLQSNYMTEKNYTQKLLNTESRIRSMALVHEKLYKSEHLSKLNAKVYISELVTNILQSVESEVPINISYKINDSQFSIDTLIPLGLIINEVVSNSVKYAFSGKEKGEISLNLTYDKITLKTIFVISDNGMGADLNYDELSHDSLGMELIQTLTEQLDGTLNLNTESGFVYTFIFSALK